MHIIKKILIIMIFTTLSLSASIVGGWQIEPEKTLKNNGQKNEFAVGMSMAVFESLDIYDNHRVVCLKASFDAKWQKNGDDYIMVDDSGKVPLKQLDNDHIMVTVEAFDIPNISLFYKRVDLREDIKLDGSITKLKLDSIYRSKKINGESHLQIQLRQPPNFNLS